MITPYKLSICIPTYNRVAMLKPLLEQICSLVERDATHGQVEVCISDNGSKDRTWPLLQEFEEQNTFISCRRNEKNQGFGRNFWETAAMAEGEYIYFTGDDDQFEENAISTLLSNVESGADLVLVNSHPASGFHESAFDPGEIASLDSLEIYLEKVGFFHGSFIGNLQFKRDVFLRHCDIGDAVQKSAYPHLFPVFRTLRAGHCVFSNQPITKPDDTTRGWSEMQPIYTAVDLARIARQEIVPYLRKAQGRDLLRQLGRSLPRAFLRSWKREIVIDQENSYQNLRIKNLMEIYF